MSYTILIPARTNSSRIYRKLYEKIEDKSVIERTWLQAICAAPSEVYIVCKDTEIRDFCKSFGANTFLTNGQEDNGTEACAQAAKVLGLTGTIACLQGDECFIHIRAVNQCVEDTQSSSEVGTLVIPYRKLEAPGTVFVVMNVKQEAIYFSRCAIPYSVESPAYRHKHIGVYVCDREQLDKYASLPMTVLEKRENLEQLRWLYNKVDIHCTIWEYHIRNAINTKEDLI